ncbi:MAG: DUF1572 domain-containing protein [Bacteroidota bacterium]|nr:DUF1572 domain-containing protein [Bacteroidota bacterium]
MAGTDDLRDAIIREVHLRLYEECLPRILRCIDQLNDEELWWRPNENSNSIGNLVLHLCGNVRQWIYSGLGRGQDMRHRQYEFDERRIIPKKELRDALSSILELVRPVILNVPTEELLNIRAVQTFEETGLTILIHVTEHFSYHTGQIAYITKMLTDRPLDFYAGIPLE